MVEEKAIRRNRSFGRKHGRKLRTPQKNLLEERLPALSISLLKTGRLDPTTLFPDKKAIWLEIGFGRGEHLAAQARAHPDIGCIGCEVYISGIAKLLQQLEDQDTDNIRFFTDDARLLLDALPPASLARIFILFADPWPKKRHHKRRLINHDTLSQLTTLLAPGGKLRIASDHREYIRWILVHMHTHPDLIWQAQKASDWHTPPPDHHQTRYEQKARAEEKIPIFLDFIRKKAHNTSE